MTARILLACLALVGSACGSLMPHPPARGRSETGFLSAYGGLEPAAGRPAVFVWRRPDLDLAPYDCVVVERPSLRRRHDDTLPAPEIREALCTELRERLQEALKAEYRIVPSVEDLDRSQDAPLRIRVAVTTALLDRGELPPQGEWQGWGDRPAEFSLECEVVDGRNARPVAKLVVFDRTGTIPANQVTPWERSSPLFVRWAADVAWLVQRPESPAAASPPTAAPAETPSEPVEELEPSATPAAAPEPAPVST